MRIKGLLSVTSVGVEFFGKNGPNAFRSLESLEFEDMPKWENWNFSEVDEEARKFPSLRGLLIRNCPELLGSIPEYLPFLEKLVIFNCKRLVISIQSLPMLSELNIYGCNKVEYKGSESDSSLKTVSLSKIPKFTCAAEWLGSIKVESLVIDGCEEFCWGLLTQSMSLGYLKIGNLPQLVPIGAEEERQELMQYLKIPCSIQQLIIENCQKLEKLSTTLHYLTSLTVLELCFCPKLISLSKNNLPLNLKSLVILGCKSLECLLEGENVNISHPCLLEQLDIGYCQSLVSLSSTGQLPTRLKQLRIFSCEKLESIAQEIQDNSS